VSWFLNDGCPVCGAPVQMLEVRPTRPGDWEYRFQRAIWEYLDPDGGQHDCDLTLLRGRTATERIAPEPTGLLAAWGIPHEEIPGQRDTVPPLSRDSVPPSESPPDPPAPPQSKPRGRGGVEI
jgi:hypothetical protein